ncbi:MAG: ABC transporter permease [Candidatus Brocadiaceae bacterium]|nr:ABC transporter permease [Candidatus Brocadiaceae bacterium]
MSTETRNDVPAARSLYAEAWRTLRRRRVAMICLGVIAAYVFIGLLDMVPVKRESAPGGRMVSLAEWAMHAVIGPADRDRSYVPPLTGRHLLGTDIMGRDVLFKAVRGVRTALILGGLTALIAIPLGLFFGVLAGYFGRWVDDLIVYVYSTLACIPGILLLIALMLVMGKGLVQLCIAMGVTSWVGLCRLVRGETMKLREADYVLAARAVGASAPRIIVRHIVPNVLHIVVITFTLGFSGIVMSEAVLSYIGIGVEATTVSWGTMIAEARMEVSREPSVWWHLAGGAGALFVLVLALNVFGDALRDALDPKLRTQ